MIVTLSMMCKLWKYVTRKCVLYVRAGYLAHFNQREGCSHEWSAKRRFVISCIPWMVVYGYSSWNFCVWFVQNPVQIFMERLGATWQMPWQDFNFLLWFLKNVSGDWLSPSDLTKVFLRLPFFLVPFCRYWHVLKPETTKQNETTKTKPPKPPKRNHRNDRND